ncbi:Family of unknown function (DUF500) domain containing protein [Naviculisporaceae sp. PSN 640]
MQRVSAFLPSWDRPRSTSSIPASSTTTSTTTTTIKRPAALDKVFGWAEKIAAPANRTSTTTPAAPTRYGRENYWPAPLDKECDKAARILKSFCTDGFLAQETESSEQSEVPSTPNFVSKIIPPRIIQNAVGLAIFSCMRSGLWMSGSGGAGLITARKADGTWSPPSGIILHTAGLGFVLGVDIYDCVLVINSVQTLEMFTRPKLILGSDVSLSVGPLISTDAVDRSMRWKGLDDTVLTYVKARGKHQAVPLDGSLVSERGNENMRFYCGDVGVLDILAGNIPKSIPEMRPLFEVIKAAEGRSDYDKELMAVLAQQPAPGDAVIETPKASPTSPKTPFGIPSADDPDPFGVIGLEMAGIEIREAGTHLRPASTQFEYNPSPTSPVFGRFSRQSIDTYLSNRGSYMSAKTQGTAMTDACTQTDVASTAETSFSRANSDDGRDNMPEKLPTVLEPEEVDYTKIDTSMIERFTPKPIEEPEELTTKIDLAGVERHDRIETIDQDSTTDNVEKLIAPPASDERDEDADDEDEDEDEEEEPIICEVATAAQPTRTSIRTSQVTQVIHAKGAIVTIPKRIPPPLPARSPARASRGSKTEVGDVSSLKSPLRNSFMSADSQPVSDSTADTSAVESFATPLETNEATLTKESLGGDLPESRGHRKNTSSVYTAVPSPLERYDSAESSPQIPPTPQRVELTSSAEESDREPQTPKTDTGFVGVGSNNKPGDLVRAANEVSIVSPH